MVLYIGPYRGSTSDWSTSQIYDLRTHRIIHFMDFLLKIGSFLGFLHDPTLKDTLRYSYLSFGVQYGSPMVDKPMV